MIRSLGRLAKYSNKIIIGLALLIAVVVEIQAEQKLYFVHSDHLGTPQLLTDENQTVVWKAEYSPFGEATVDEDPDGDGVNIEFNLRFPGQYYDKETDTAYNIYRTYDAKTGRYDQSDLIGLQGGINTYSYVLNNPISNIDPLGLDTIVIYGRGIASNPLGHSALGFTGKGVYSYGTTHPFGSSVTDYLRDQSEYRSSIVVILPTTPEQEEKMIEAMESVAGSDYSYLGNNCATTNVDAMAAAGIGHPLPIIPFLPTSVRDIAWAQEGGTSIFLPQGTPIPDDLNQFNPEDCSCSN